MQRLGRISGYAAGQRGWEGAQLPLFGLDVVNPSANDMVPYLSLPESLIAIGTPRMSAMGHQVMNWHASKKANIVT